MTDISKLSYKELQQLEKQIEELEQGHLKIGVLSGMIALSTKIL